MILPVSSDAGVLRARGDQSYPIGQVEVHIPFILRTDPLPPIGDLDGIATALGIQLGSGPSPFLAETLKEIQVIPPPRLRHLNVKFISDGNFQYVARVNLQPVSGEPLEFCLNVAKVPQNNVATFREYGHICRSHKKDPSLIVQPLAAGKLRTRSGELLMYSTRFYPNHHQLAYTIDGVDGRAGFFRFGSNLPAGLRIANFEPDEQQIILDEMVALLTVYFDEKTGGIPVMVMLGAGDFMVQLIDPQRPEVMLTTVREVVSADLSDSDLKAANFIHYLKRFYAFAGGYAVLLFNDNTIRRGVIKGLQRKGLDRRDAEKTANWWLEVYGVKKIVGGLRDDLVPIHSRVRAILTHDQVMERAALIRSGDIGEIASSLARASRPVRERRI